MAGDASGLSSEVRREGALSPLELGVLGIPDSRLMTFIIVMIPAALSLTWPSKPDLANHSQWLEKHLDVWNIVCGVKYRKERVPAFRYTGTIHPPERLG